MKGELTFKILEKVGEVALGTAALFAAIVVSPYGSSAARIGRTQEMILEGMEEGFHVQETRNKFSKLVSKLKREGLIVAGEGGSLHLTHKGKGAYARLKKVLAARLPHVKKYEPAATSSLTVVVFDIPEKYRHKRAWLRAVLKRLEFTLLQESVWVGKKALPEEFIKDIERVQLAPYVEIFGVGKTGSLEHV